MPKLRHTPPWWTTPPHNHRRWSIALPTTTHSRQGAPALARAPCGRDLSRSSRARRALGIAGPPPRSSRQTQPPQVIESFAGGRDNDGDQPPLPLLRTWAFLLRLFCAQKPSTASGFAALHPAGAHFCRATAAAAGRDCRGGAAYARTRACVWTVACTRTSALAAAVWMGVGRRLMGNGGFWPRQRMGGVGVVLALRRYCFCLSVPARDLWMVGGGDLWRWQSIMCRDSCGAGARPVEGGCRRRRRRRSELGPNVCALPASSLLRRLPHTLGLKPGKACAVTGAVGVDDMAGVAGVTGVVHG